MRRSGSTLAWLLDELGQQGAREGGGGAVRVHGGQLQAPQRQRGRQARRQGPPRRRAVFPVAPRTGLSTWTSLRCARRCCRARCKRLHADRPLLNSGIQLVQCASGSVTWRQAQGQLGLWVLLRAASGSVWEGAKREACQAVYDAL